MKATRSSPIPVSMFFIGSSPTMLKSVFDFTSLMRYCMNTKFQIST